MLNLLMNRNFHSEPSFIIPPIPATQRILVQNGRVGYPWNCFLKLRLSANPVFPVPFPLVHELVNPVNECLHFFLRPPLCYTDTHRYMDVLPRRWREMLLLELRPDSFRSNCASRASCHGQEDGKFFAAITIGRIGLAQASFDHLTKSP